MHTAAISSFLMNNKVGIKVGRRLSCTDQAGTRFRSEVMLGILIGCGSFWEVCAASLSVHDAMAARTMRIPCTLQII